MTVEYLDLADFVNIAAAVTGLGVDTVMKVANLDLADSALHAPAAGFDDAEAAVVAIASGEWDEQTTANWLRAHLTEIRDA